ncbi:hypothetical protein T05_4962 [Trichinella murrelli]|uniref:Uncharacterized protein n=1 Tax=Trichinella murrelli TaxID=144512 RepID=A0A0V0SPC6_9BILA|nr:hypothetical protein T05_4962 [Trichinella murrelli]
MSTTHDSKFSLLTYFSTRCGIRTFLCLGRS